MKMLPGESTKLHLEIFKDDIFYRKLHWVHLTLIGIDTFCIGILGLQEPVLSQICVPKQSKELRPLVPNKQARIYAKGMGKKQCISATEISNKSSPKPKDNIAHVC